MIANLNSQESLQNILTEYDVFILDIWGVVHDGKDLLPGIQDFLDNITSLNKHYVFLSNAPRPANVVREKFTQLGLAFVHDNIITSGDFFLHEYQSNTPTLFQNLRGSAYIIGEQYNTDLLANHDIHIASSPQDADYILYLAFADTDEELQHLEKELTDLAHIGLPMICVNPDVSVYHGNHLKYCQGHFAKLYESLGCEVFYYGKPQKEIYEHLFAKFQLSPDKAIMIGDSLSTDIIGANNAGIDSALVLTGLHKDERNVANLLKISTTTPTYVLSNLALHP